MHIADADYDAAVAHLRAAGLDVREHEFGACRALARRLRRRPRRPPRRALDLGRGRVIFSPEPTQSNRSRSYGPPVRAVAVDERPVDLDPLGAAAELHAAARPSRRRRAVSSSTSETEVSTVPSRSIRAARRDARLALAATATAVEQRLATARFAGSRRSSRSDGLRQPCCRSLGVAVAERELARRRRGPNVYSTSHSSRAAAGRRQAGQRRLAAVDATRGSSRCQRRRGSCAQPSAAARCRRRARPGRRGSLSPAARARRSPSTSPRALDRVPRPAGGPRSAALSIACARKRRRRLVRERPAATRPARRAARRRVTPASNCTGPRGSRRRRRRPTPCRRRSHVGDDRPVRLRRDRQRPACPTSTLNAVTEPSWPVVSDRSGHGASPAARPRAASRCRRATTHSAEPHLARDEARRASGAPTAGAARTSTAATRAMSGDVLERGLAGGGRVRTTPIGPRPKNSRPRAQARLTMQRVARVAGDVEQRLGVDAEEDRGRRAHDRDEDDLGLAQRRVRAGLAARRAGLARRPRPSRRRSPGARAAAERRRRPRTARASRPPRPRAGSRPARPPSRARSRCRARRSRCRRPR